MRFISLLLALSLVASAAPRKISFLVQKINDGKKDITVLTPVMAVYFEIEQAEQLGLSKGEAVNCSAIPAEKRNPASGDVMQTFDLDCGPAGKMTIQRIFLQEHR